MCSSAQLHSGLPYPAYPVQVHNLPVLFELIFESVQNDSEVRMCTCVHAHMCTCVHAHMCACVHARVCVRAFVHPCVT